MISRLFYGRMKTRFKTAMLCIMQVSDHITLRLGPKPGLFPKIIKDIVRIHPKIQIVFSREIKLERSKFLRHDTG